MKNRNHDLESCRDHKQAAHGPGAVFAARSRSYLKILFLSAIVCGCSASRETEAASLPPINIPWLSAQKPTRGPVASEPPGSTFYVYEFNSPYATIVGEATSALPAQDWRVNKHNDFATVVMITPPPGFTSVSFNISSGTYEGRDPTSKCNVMLRIRQ
ncbi:MAG: hypothetical protein ABL949_12055 [Fimbriimonadaceae bacterium]